MCAAVQTVESADNLARPRHLALSRGLISSSFSLKTLQLQTFGGLRVENDARGAESGPRPRPLALLAILAIAGSNGVSRERLLGVLWPESPPDRARHALSQTLYSLRRDLGAEVVLSTPDLRLDTRLITSDVEAFRHAVAENKWREAAALYVGPFLDGFYLADAPEFERWVESERATLAVDGIRAIEIVAKEDAAAGRLGQSIDAWRRLTRFDPLSARVACAYMETLSAGGDRAAALAHGNSYTDLVRRELDTAPDPAVQRLMARLRDMGNVAPHAASPGAIDAANRPPPTGSTPNQTTHVAATSRATESRAALRLVGVVVAFIALIAVGAVIWRTIARRAERPPILAVGRVRDLVAPDSAIFGAVLSEMLATSLGRLHELQVVANSRMLELTPPRADTARSAISDAARRAGATEILEGELVTIAGRQLRLNVRRVDIARGIVLGGYQVTGRDRAVLLDSVTALIAMDLRVKPPEGTLADVSTRSPAAYRLYDDGLRAFYQFDSYAANRLFHAAIRQDSLFAMATYYAWRSASAVGGLDQDSLAGRALALAARASDRDRLLILAHVGFSLADPRAVAAAETLATRYANDPDALIRAAEVLNEPLRWIGLLNQSIAIDSVADVVPDTPCRRCDALHVLATRYAQSDSTAAVDRTLARWIGLRPDDPAPWLMTADHLIGQGKRSEANVAQRHGEALGGKSYPQRELIWSLRTDDIAAIRTQCRAALGVANVDEYLAYRWYCTIGLRMQGRYRDALALIRDGRIPETGMVRRGLPADSTHSAILDMEMGRPLVAAAEFAALGTLSADSMRYGAGQRARANAWRLTLVATALAADNDTIRTRALVDSIEAIGRRTAYGRDPLLHHFVRGLLFAKAQQHAAAVHQFQAATFSPTYGYSRINYEMAKSFLALNRPADAVRALRAVLHGGVEGSGLYLTRTEAHELLARAFDEAGQRDSATAHYAVVERAWRDADPVLKPRYEAARLRLQRTSRAGR